MAKKPPTTPKIPPGTFFSAYMDALCDTAKEIRSTHTDPTSELRDDIRIVKSQQRRLLAEQDQYSYWTPQYWQIDRSAKQREDEIRKLESGIPELEVERDALRLKEKEMREQGKDLAYSYLAFLRYNAGDRGVIKVLLDTMMPSIMQFSRAKSKEEKEISYLETVTGGGKASGWKLPLLQEFIHLTATNAHYQNRKGKGVLPEDREMPSPHSLRAGTYGEVRKRKRRNLYKLIAGAGLLVGGGTPISPLPMGKLAKETYIPLMTGAVNIGSNEYLRQPTRSAQIENDLAVANKAIEDIQSEFERNQVAYLNEAEKVRKCVDEVEKCTKAAEEAKKADREARMQSVVRDKPKDKPKSKSQQELAKAFEDFRAEEERPKPIFGLRSLIGGGVTIEKSPSYNWGEGSGAGKKSIEDFAVDITPEKLASMEESWEEQDRIAKALGSRRANIMLEAARGNLTQSLKMMELHLSYMEKCSQALKKKISGSFEDQVAEFVDRVFSYPEDINTACRVLNKLLGDATVANTDTRAQIKKKLTIAIDKNYTSTANKMDGFLEDLRDSKEEKPTTMRYYLTQDSRRDILLKADQNFNDTLKWTLVVGAMLSFGAWLLTKGLRDDPEKQMSEETERAMQKFEKRMMSVLGVRTEEEAKEAGRLVGDLSLEAFGPVILSQLTAEQRQGRQI